MSAHLLLNLLNELGKSDKMRGLSSIFSLFRNELNKFKKYKSTNVTCRFYFSYAIKFTLKSHICRKEFIMYATLLWTSFHTCNLAENV